MITIFAIRRRREVYEELLKNSGEQVPVPDQLPRHGERVAVKLKPKGCRGNVNLSG